MVCVIQVGLWDGFKQCIFYFAYGFAGGESGAVGDAKDMGVHCHSRLAKGGVEYYIGGFTADTGQGF